MRLKITLLIVALAALLIGQAVLAQQATTQSAQDTIELIGTIDVVNADGSIVVNGVTITITTAELNVVLAVGQVVKVEGTLLADGRIAAREVQAPRADDVQDDDEIELTGVVESFDGTTLVVNGLVIDVTGAEINDPIVVGQPIRVHASFDANGNLIARETDNNVDDDDDDVPSPESTPEADDDNGDDDDDRPGEFEIVGTLEQVGDGFIVVNGQTIRITGAEIKHQLVVGALVKLHLSNQNGQLVAREVENARSRNDDEDDNSGPGSGDDDDRWDEVYTVRPGDTLSSIAARAGVTVEELASVNHITDPSVMVAGTQLIVPHDFDDDDNNGHSGSGSSDDSGDDDDNSGPGGGFDDDGNDDRGGSDDNGQDDHDDDDGGSSGSGSSDDDDDGGSDDSGDDDDDDGGNSGSGGGGDDDDD